ncbi:hypothetical protein QR680_001346 [Steinernema hermaphroditum]|uniref:Tyrosine specific protein phosphatases domain-containing protein n=1 Tax=Steinernema hermaphroditum TaxID=289476 RepID=A0AA39GZG6_9BILA|nr:hypothetical protein QR680_001346 [Steinernema hermaphroditum]
MLSRMRSEEKARKKRQIPDKWRNYECTGKRLSSARFVAFKTPLDKTYFEDNPEEAGPSSEWFTVENCLRRLHAEGVTLGMVIDLTSSDKYYKSSEFEKHDIEHVKIKCRGHVGDKEKDRFQKVVNRFLRHNESNEKVIGVHCAHGLNRTGYMICLYLMECNGMKPADAVAEFEAARGHTIELGRQQLLGFR